MGLDAFNLALVGTVFLIYGTCCVISVIFTFFLPTYLKIEEKSGLEILSSRKFTPLETNINFFNVWMTERNRIVGPFLILLSLVDLTLFISIINTL